MNLRRAVCIAACMFPIAIGPAAAQFQPPQQSQQPAASPWEVQPQQMPPCVKEFGKLRDDAQRKAGAIRAAGARKAPAKEACGLFNAFYAAEAKMMKYAGDNAASCGIPPQVLTTIKQAHAKTAEIRTKVCQAAAAPMQQQGPSLSDALGSSAVPDANNIKTGRGTFDTLTGTPLGNK